MMLLNSGTELGGKIKRFNDTSDTKLVLVSRLSLAILLSSNSDESEKLKSLVESCATQDAFKM